MKILYIRSDYIYHDGSSPDLYSVLQSGLIARGKDTKEGRQAVFLTAVNPVTDAQEDEPHDVTNPRKVSYKTEWKVYQDAVHWTHLKKNSGERIKHSGKPDPMLLSFMTLYQPTVLKKWCEPKTEEILYQKASLSPRPPPKIILKDAWQVQHENYHQRGTNTGRPVADEGKMEPNIDFRIQGIPHPAVEPEEDDRTRLIG